MMKEEPKKNIKLEDLAFYFDAQEKNIIDHGRLGRKSGQVLVMREKLLSLPDHEFDAAIHSISKLVAREGDAVKPYGKKEHREHQMHAKELYEQTMGATSLSEVPKV